MKGEKLQAAVIGMGEGFRHINAYQLCPDYDLVALCDIHPERCVQRRDEYRLPADILWYENYLDVVKNPDIDVVSVTSPE